MKQILIVDDEQQMLDLIALYLSPLGYHCKKINSAIDALLYLESNPVDLILLDLMMPDMNGWEACIEIKKYWETPIIMLTARTDKKDVVKGLNTGADDYISKPFDGEELVARIEAVLRRKGNRSELIEFDGLVLDQESFDLQYQTKNIPLTPKEFALMKLFLQNLNKVFTRDHLIHSIWGHGVETEDRTIDSHIRNLRDKLRKAGFPSEEYLLTVWGVGYKWIGKESD
ncbi:MULTISPECIES: response regulator transcription factor [Niallia]|uniref:Response regulator transcription factor n=1 Tax=Niallia taxi TaxID=2499688 RepID=A0A3S2U878_9BACI|nr:MULTISPECIES: response regulator transcription factor [Niallia]MDK8643686.1 response regulator transcription factor [Niallia taxi]MED4038289.1 response regulator transcription factor [Niallia taxi]MED4057596.1 response regulator transcription factor [Niallia taxi]MED4120626.1 response regulator transcription factor [Niallia taxi]RVT59442.1 response regulator transcription factor [Niallia taxi]